MLALVLRIPQRNDLNVLATLRGFLRKNPLQSLADIQIETPAGQLARRHIIGKDLTKAQLLTLKAVLEFARRVLDRGMGVEPSITSPVDVLPELRDIKDKKREYFVTVFLNARNQIIQREIVSVGSLSASLVHPREVFAPAIASSAASVISWRIIIPQMTVRLQGKTSNSRAVLCKLARSWELRFLTTSLSARIGSSR